MKHLRTYESKEMKKYVLINRPRGGDKLQDEAYKWMENNVGEVQFSKASFYSIFFRNTGYTQFIPIWVYIKDIYYQADTKEECEVALQTIKYNL